MFARFLALFATLPVLVSAGGQPAGLAIYLKTGVAEASAVTDMKRELANLMRSAGYSVRWLDAPTALDVRNTALVVLDLQGDCASRAVLRSASPDIQLNSLASTAVSGGEVLPFSTLHCDVLNRVLGAAIGEAPIEIGPWLYGRSMARLAAHELYHVLSNTREHSRDGVSKPCFSARDLLTDNFEFEASALVKLRRAETAGASSSSAARDSVDR